MKETDGLVLAISCIVFVCVLASCMMDCNPYLAYEHTADGNREYIHFKSSYLEEDSVYIHITEEEYRASMIEMGIRSGMTFKEIPDTFVREERAVRVIADYLMDKYPTDYERARGAAMLCQSAIRYCSDDALYGYSEYWARPTETLYNMAGDCEDTAILFCSLCKCMNIKTVLLVSPEHVASAVCVPCVREPYCVVDGEEYFFVITSVSGDTLYTIGEDEDWDMKIYDGGNNAMYYLYSYYKLIGDKVMRWI